MKKIFLGIAKAVGVVFSLVLVYVLAALLLPFLEVPAKPAGEPKSIETYILTNGVHTDIVVPIVSPEMDWRAAVPFRNTKSQRTDFQYLSIGWGDKGFYLDTPEWSDLKFSTAVKAAFWLGESAMHCMFYDTMSENDQCKKIMLTETQYRDLVKFITDKFDRDRQGNFILIPTEAVYGEDDAFYEAKGSYNFLETCNTWTNNGLKVAGQKAALWTATDFGIFQHYK